MNILHLRLKLLLTLSLVFVTSISAAPFEVDGLSYEIIKGNEVKVVKDRNKNYKNYKGDIVIPSDIEHNGISYKVTCIDNAAFLECFILKSIIIPNSVTRIGAGCFQRCESLESVKLPDNLLEIGNGAFEKCYSLTSIVIPNSVTNIGSNTFSECKRLSEVIFGTSVSSIGGGVFKGCSNLTSITIPKSIERFDMSAFEDCIMNTITFEDGSEPLVFFDTNNLVRVKELYLGRNLEKSTGNSCFTNMELERVTIGSSVTEIAENCFYHAGNFDIVTIPNSVEKVNDSAFEGCKIKKLVIGKNVKEIGNFAFTTHISDVTSLNPIPPKVQRNTFVDDFSSVLRVPKGSVDAYKNEKFWKFSKKVEIDSEDDIDEIEIPEEHIKGDLNGDGNVDSADINEIEEYIMGNPSPYFDLKIADVNNDGVVNVADIVCITKDKYCKYLTFVAIDDGKFKLSGNSVQYSLDEGSTWTTLASDTYSPTLSAGQKIMWKGNLTPVTHYGVGRFASTGRFNVEGNIMSLLFNDNFAGKTDLTGYDYAFASLFNACTRLLSAENLALPATKLANNCYQVMFEYCYALESLPSLPATTLAESCYWGMFEGCISLTSVPSNYLPTTTLEDRCYQGMFYGCTSLTSPPSLPATALAEQCYLAMFADCTSLTSLPSNYLPATTLAERCYEQMFYGCTSLMSPPSLPATTLTLGCYWSMFEGCTSLTTVSDNMLPATTLAQYCYLEMFKGCTSLTSPASLPATALAVGCYWSMFEGCTSLRTAPTLPATTLAVGCYQGMFYGCSRLNYIKCLATNISAKGCTRVWVSGVSSSGTFVKAASMNSWTRGESGIPSGWAIQNDDDGKDDMSGKYLTFVALEDGYFSIKTKYTYIKYSLDEGNTWSTLGSDVNTPMVSAGQRIMWKGNLSPVQFDNAFWVPYSIGIGTFCSTGRFNVEGNAMSLLFGDDFEGKTDLTGFDNVFSYLFIGCANLISANNLVLPATTLTNYCYRSMFDGCTSLTTAPQLPATTLAKSCYGDMFSGCTSLTVAPSLPATTLASNCYYYMFYGCTSLTTAPQLPATILADYCYSRIFYGCTSLTTAPTLPATTLADWCYGNMFGGCTSLTTAPQLPATTLAKCCYNCMFWGCTSLTTAPELPATTLASDCYHGMFGGCTSLTTAPELPATTLSEYCYLFMFLGCTSLTTAPSLPATTLVQGCYNSMFSNCTSLTTAPQLPATTLSDYCYSGMFSNCTSLTTAPELPATTLVQGCYNSMFKGCSRLNYIKCLATISAEVCTSQWVNSVASSGTFVKASSMSSWSRGDSGIPANWTVQDDTTNGISSKWVMITDDFDKTIPFKKIRVLNKKAQIGSYCCIAFSTSPNENVGADRYYVSFGVLAIGDNMIHDLVHGFDISSCTPVGDNWYEYEFSCPVYFAYYQDNCPRGQVKALIQDSNNAESSKYLTFVAIDDGKFKLSGNSVQYSLDEGSTWTTLGSDTYSPTLSAGQKIMWKGNLTPNSNIGIGTFSSTGKFNVEGNIMSLLYGDDFKDKTNLSGKDYVFDGLFSGCTRLTSAENLVLPAMTLANYCYRSMFQSCTSLKKAPKLPAKTMSDWCYGLMFEGCTSLTIAPSLPANKLGESCYSFMFNGCTSLTTAPSLPCTNLAWSCYYYMFSGCTSLKTAPDLPATTLVRNCYQGMFSGCTSLNYIKCLATSISAQNCTKSWVKGVASSGTFVKTSSMTSWTTGNDGIPTNWTVQDDTTNGINSKWVMITDDFDKTIPFTKIRVLNKKAVKDAYRCIAFSTSPNKNVGVDCFFINFGTQTIGDNKPISESYGKPISSCTPVGDNWYEYEFSCPVYFAYYQDNCPRGQVKALIQSSFDAEYELTYMIDGEVYKNYKLKTGELINPENEPTKDGYSFSGWSEIPSTMPAHDVIVYGFFTEGGTTDSDDEDGNDSDNSCKYLTFVALESGTFKFSGNSVSFSLDNGSTWTTLTSDTNSPTVQSGNKIMWKGNLTPNYGIGSFSSTGRFNVEGNAMSLLFGDDFIGKTSLNGKNFAFDSLFNGCTTLTSISNLNLPATTLADNCYGAMFWGCTSLASIPGGLLPATTLASECYRDMFSYCTSLTTVPSDLLPATTLADRSYQNMFWSCTSLATAPQLPATTLADMCYNAMFYECTSLTTAPQLPATTLANSCYRGMFSNCTSLTTAPELPATTLAEGCYGGMFYNCESLTTAPELPATTLANSCYWGMFSECSSLREAPQLPAKTLASYCYNGMFRYCTSLTTAPELPASTLAEGCYGGMFIYCSRLNYIKCLATDINAEDCTTYWLSYVSSNGTFVKDSSMIGWTRGESGIPSGWTVKNE